MEIDLVRAQAAAAEARRVLTAAPGGLLDPQALAVASAIGLRVPAFVVEPPQPAFSGAVQRLGTERVVVKVLVPGLAHKSDIGGVIVTERDPAAVAAAVAAMQTRLPPGLDIAGYLIAEYLPHPAGPAGELLIGARWSDAFGPVVVLGPGGLHAERLPGAPAYFSVDDDLAPAVAASPIARTAARGPDGGAIVARLVDLVAVFRQFAVATMPSEVAEFEVNPLVLTAEGPTALDALLRPAGPVPEPAPPRPLHRIRHLLAPQTLAIVGVSAGENPGRAILRNILAAGFPAERVTVVKPGVEELDGCRCVASMGDLPGPVDLVVLATAAEQVPALVEDAAAGQRAQAAIVVAAGLGERAGTSGLEERTVAAVRASRRTSWGGPLVNGANCLGVRSVPGRLDTFFVPRERLTAAASEPSPVALLAQSGAFLLARLDHLPWLRPRYAISVGNQVDLTIADYLEYLADDVDTTVFGCYVEGLAPGDGRRMVAAARTIHRRGGAVVLYPAGRTVAGAAAAQSHTAAVAADPRVLAALAARAGVLVARSLDEFEDLLTVATRLAARTVAGLRLGALSNAGFEAVAMADHAPPLTMAPLGAPTLARLGELLRAAGAAGVVAAANPLDLTPIMADAGFAEAAAAVLADPAVDVGVIACVPFTSALRDDVDAPEALAARLVDLWRRTAKAWVAVVDAGSRYDPLAARLASGGVPTFRTCDRAVRALARYAAWRAGSEAGLPG